MSGAAVILFARGSLCGLAGCAGGVRYPRYYVLDVPQPPAPKDTSKPILGSAAAKELQERGLFQSIDLYDGRQSPDCLITGSLDHLEELDEDSNVGRGPMARHVDQNSKSGRSLGFWRRLGNVSWARHCG